MAEVLGPTLEGYLNTNPEVKSAREQLAKAKKVLDEANAALTGSRNATQDVRDDLKVIQSKAQENFNTLQSLAKEAQKVATDYFKTNYQDISLSSFDKSIEGLQVAKTQARSPEAAAGIQSQIDALVEARKTPRVYKEPPKKIVKPGKTVEPGEVTQDQVSKEDQKIMDSITAQYEKDVVNAGTYITRELDKKGKSDLAIQLNATFPNLKLRTDGEYDPSLIDAYKEALQLNLNRSLNSLESIPFADFLVITEKEGTYRSGTGGEPSLSGSISDPTKAAGLINSAFRTQLNRDPTAAEITKYTKILNNAEKKNPFKTVKGITTGGLDKEQFLIGEVVKLPEFAKKKTDKTALTSQSILGTARANGVTLNQTQLDSLAKRVQDGTDIKVINNEIRGIAGLGMPEKVQKLLSEGIDLDTVYSPYKNVMASILELNPESIDLKDPTLRSAFGPDKETSIYDFEKTLRKDYRWQYTDNAKRDVSNVALKVLRDFGFQA